MSTLYTKKDIIVALRKAGVSRGDTLFLHSNIGFFGTLEGSGSSEEYCRAFLDALLDLVGEEGNICVPTFTYSFCRGRDFDPQTTPSAMGILSEYVRTRTQALRSQDANFSVAVIGPMAGALTRNAPEHSFGKGSIWERLLQNRGKLCNLNFGAGSTFVHYIERQMSVPYRWDKAFFGRVLNEGRWEARKCIHFVRPLDKPEMNTDLSKIHRMASEKQLVSQAALGRGSVICVDLRSFYRAFCDEIAKNPYCLTVAGQKIE